MGLLDFAFDDTFVPSPMGVNPFKTPFVPMTNAAPNAGGVTPMVLPRRSPRRTMYQDPILAIAAQQQAMSPSGMAMPSVLPKSKPQMQGPMPAPKPMGAPDFVTAMPKPQLVQPTQAPSAPQGGLLGNLLADDITSAKGRGIMSAAASLLDSGGPVSGQPAPSLGQSIARAYTSGMTAFDKQEAAEAAKASAAINDKYKQAMTDQMIQSMNRPKRTALAGGAYSLVENPDGTTEIIKNEGIQEAILDQKRAQVAIDIETAAAKKKAANPLGLTDADKELDKTMAKDLPEKRGGVV